MTRYDYYPKFFYLWIIFKVKIDLILDGAVETKFLRDPTSTFLYH